MKKGGKRRERGGGNTPIAPVELAEDVNDTFIQVENPAIELVLGLRAGDQARGGEAVWGAEELRCYLL